MKTIQDDKSGVLYALSVEAGKLFLVEAASQPVIIDAYISPNPAQAGQPVLISVAAIDVECVPSTQIVTAGEFTSGEV